MTAVLPAPLRLGQAPWTRSGRQRAGSATFSQRQIVECRNVGLLVGDRTAVEALENAAPREEITRLQFGGISVPKAVDVAPSTS